MGGGDSFGISYCNNLETHLHGEWVPVAWSGDAGLGGGIWPLLVLLLGHVEVMCCYVASYCTSTAAGAVL